MPDVRLNSEKYARNAAAGSGDYEAGVRNPRRSQSQAAIAAKGNYEAGIQASIAAGSFEKGLQKSGDAKWQKGVLEKGRARFQQGVLTAKDEWQSGFEPFAGVIRSLSLQPRGPKGQNYGRVQQIGDALRNAKLSK